LVTIFLFFIKFPLPSTYLLPYRCSGVPAANQWRSSKRCAYCNHRCAAVLPHTQGCPIKERNE